MRRLIPILALCLFIFWPHSASAAITEITAAECSASTTTCTGGTVAVGDLLIGAGYNSGATTAVTVPAGWTSIVGGTGANTNAMAVGCAVATGTSFTTGTWTNATRMGVLVFRGTNAGTTADCIHTITNNAATGGTFATGGASSATMAFNTFTLNEKNSTSWVVGVGGHRTATNLAAPTGMTASETINTGPSFIMASTNGAVNTWSTTNVSVNASSGWRTVTLEIKAACADYTCADAFIDMEGTSAGTTVSAGNMATATINSSFIGTWSTTTPTGLTFHATQSGNPKCTVTIENTATQYPVNHTKQSMALDDTKTTAIADISPAGTTWYNASIGFFLTYGPASNSNAVWDIVRVDTGAGHYSIIQEDTTGATNGLRLEGDPGGVTTTSSDINLTQGHIYWVSFTSNFDNSLATLHVYDPSSSWAQVSGSPVTVGIDNATFPYLGDIIFGNDGGSGTSADTTYFENILVDVSLAQNPIGPGSCSTGSGTAKAPPMMMY